MPGTRLGAILYRRDGEARPGWRILLYFFTFALLAIVGQLAVSVLPRHPLQWGSLIMTTIAAIVAGWILLVRIDRRPFGALGFPLHRRTARESIIGFLVGSTLIGAAVLLLVLSGAVAFVADSGGPLDYVVFLAWTLIFFAIAAAWEEAVFRGYPFQVLVQWIGPGRATILASALFALLHAQNPNVTPFALGNIFLAGILLSIVYLRTRSLWYATGVHLGWNYTMASLLDFPVSGLAFEAPLYSGVLRGPDWWTGGSFGPEAGVAGSLALIAGTAWALRTPRLAPDPEITRLRPLVDERMEVSQS